MPEAWCLVVVLVIVVVVVSSDSRNSGHGLGDGLGLGLGRGIDTGGPARLQEWSEIERLVRSTRVLLTDAVEVYLAVGDAAAARRCLQLHTGEASLMQGVRLRRLMRRVDVRAGPMSSVARSAAAGDDVLRLTRWTQKQLTRHAAIHAQLDTLEKHLQQRAASFGSLGGADSAVVHELRTSGLRASDALDTLRFVHSDCGGDLLLAAPCAAARGVLRLL